MSCSTKFATAAGLVLLLAGGQAAAGELTYDIYGKVHVSLNGVSNSEESGLTLSSNASYFGLKGNFDASERIAVIWQFEGEFNTAEDDFNFGFNRNTYVGLEGRYGKVIVGTHDTPVKTLGRKVTWFVDTIGDFRSMTMGVDRRFSENILYALPEMDIGLGGQLAYRLDQGDWTDPTAASASALNGMLYFAPSDFLVGLGYQSQGSGNFNPDPDEAKTETVFRGVGRFEAGKFGISGLYQSISDYGGSEGLSAMTYGFEGMFMPWQRWRLKGLYYATDPNTDLANDGYAQLAFGIDYVVDRATFYLQYATVMNDDDQWVGLGNNDWGDIVLPSDYGATASGISLGMWLTF